MTAERERASERARGPVFEEGKPLALGDTDENPLGIGFRALLLEDFRTHGGDPLSPGFWALAVHRFGNRRMGVRSRALRAPLTVAYRVAYRAVIALFGIDLPYNAKIGRRFRIAHHGCFHLGARAVGDDVYIRHSATIGLARRTEIAFAPTIGDRVEVGPGACIVGDIHIGDDCFVGPNTVLADDLAPGATALGVPARVVDLKQYVERPGG
ncbi:MAG: transferase [Polyangiaceae bacterium]|nr:transferase [Polyangiaceae bacterium]